MQYQELIGMDAPHLVVKLPKIIESLESLFFHVYPHFPTREERLSKSITKRGRERSSWGFDRNARELVTQENFKNFIQETFVDNTSGQENTVFSVSSNALTLDFLSKEVNKLLSDYFLSIRSMCQLQNGSNAHIPMMDFECPVSLDNVEAIKIVLQNLGQRSGAILESGRSYHYIGFEVLSENEWLTFLGKCILAAPFVHTRYVGHSLIRRACPLRISTNVHKPEVPKVVAVLC